MTFAVNAQLPTPNDQPLQIPTSELSQAFGSKFKATPLMQ